MTKRWPIEEQLERAEKEGGSMLGTEGDIAEIAIAALKKIVNMSDDPWNMNLYDVEAVNKIARRALEMQDETSD